MPLASFASEQCASSNEFCAPLKQWNFSLALGAGTLTNPLHGGENIPLVIIPYIHFYGEEFFIENNVIGYSFYQSEDWVISAVSQLNREKAFFTDWQPSHLFLPNFSEALTGVDANQAVSKNDVKSRKWALDAGIQINWFVSDSLEVKGQLLHDINRAYQGFNAHLSLYKNISFETLKNTHLVLGAGVNWQSAQLTDYYYGLDENDDVDLFNFYQAKSAINPFVSIDVAHKINGNWQVKLAVKREFLDKQISQSPLVKDQHISSAFVGVVYAF